jgi:TRAP-type C4-dicarboxylate transport system permease small subunit
MGTFMWAALQWAHNFYQALMQAVDLAKGFLLMALPIAILWIIAIERCLAYVRRVLERILANLSQTPAPC